ncbi:hypothetical protein OROGR_028677 [Orobanche gracilis]
MAWGIMSKCEGGKDAGSVVLERPLRLWSLLIDSVRCGIQRPNGKTKQPGSYKLSDLLKQPECWENDQEELRRKEEVLEGLKKVAKKLQGGSVLVGAAEVRRLTKDDQEARTTLALLGVIPPLVSLLDAEDPTFHSQIAALYALVNLSITNDANKSAIVRAGAVQKMLKLIECGNAAVAAAVVANFLGLSALDSNKPIIGSSGDAIPFLMEILIDKKNNNNAQAKQDSLRALYNLSISHSNVYAMLGDHLIPHLFTKLGNHMDTSERILCILGNIVSVAEGRERISRVPDAIPILVDVFDWMDSPGCQEKASYILMVMALKSSYADRRAMIEAGIVSSLLELTLVGSLLAQKRASRMLECLRLVEKGKQVVTITTAVSAPLTSSSSSLLVLDLDPTHKSSMDDGNSDDDDMMSQENKAVKQLVQQSLHNNMKMMVQRANLPHDFVPSGHFKSLTSSSSSSSSSTSTSSKSLPF